MTGKSSFIMYTRYSKLFSMLSAEDLSKLIFAVFAYVESGEVPNFCDNDGLNMLFAVMRVDLDRDSKKYEESKARMSEGGKKGAEMRWNK